MDSFNDLGQEDKGSFGGRWRSLPRGGGSIGSSKDLSGQLHRSASNYMPKGQYRMMQDQQRLGVRLRSSSVQSNGIIRGGSKRYCNTTHKNNLSEALSSNGDTCGLVKNFGERLYQRGMRRKEEMQKLVQRAKSEQDRKEVANYSFKPQINPISRQMTR